MIKKINDSKSWFFEKTSKIDKPLTKFIKKKKRERTQINKPKNEREVTTDTKEIQTIVRKYKQLYANKLNTLDKTDKFLETCNLNIQKLIRKNQRL